MPTNLPSSFYPDPRQQREACDQQKFQADAQAAAMHTLMYAEFLPDETLEDLLDATEVEIANRELGD